MSASRILVVEDEAIVSMEIVQRLSALGYEPAGRASTGDQAIAMADSLRPDLVLMDIRLRGPMDGIAAAEVIRRRFHTPVIFLTAYSEDDTLERAKLAEPYGYILKPFHDLELRSAIEIALYKHGAEKEIRRLNRIYDVLSQVSQTIVHVKSRDDLLPSVCRLLVERGAVDLAWIGLLDAETSRIVPAAHYGSGHEILTEEIFYCDEQLEGEEDPGKAILEDRPYICNKCGKDPDLYPRKQSIREYGFQSCASFPLRSHGQILGVLNIWVREPVFFREREVGLLEEVALNVSFALDKIDSEAKRERVEEALRESEERLRLFIGHTPVALAMLDRQMRYLYFSRRWLSDFNLGDRDLTGLSHYEVFPEIPEYWKAAHRRALSGEVAQAESDRFERADGSVQWLHWEVRPWRDRTGEVAGVVIFSEDVTERKQIEEERSRAAIQLRQAQKMEAIGLLAGGIAHDFNNILSAILGYGEMALHDAPDETNLRKYVQQVLNAGYRARDLVKQILTFSRQTSREPSPVEIVYIVKETIKMLRAILPSTIAITHKVAISKNSRIMADPTEIHQIMMNLGANAAHAMREKGGNLDVELTEISFAKGEPLPHPDLTPGDYIKLRVSDTGHGIEEEIAAKIFDPFFTTKPKGEGTGMGLSVTHGIIKNCNGAITVESSPGNGSVFCAYLPKVTLESLGQSKESKDAHAGTGRILFVDDEELLTELGKRMLGQLGYSVTVKTSSLEALETFKSMPDRFDLLITDYTMPSMTGLDLAKEVKKIRPDMPVLICSGHNDSINETTASLFDIEGFLAKPFDKREISRVIQKILGKK